MSNQNRCSTKSQRSGLPTRGHDAELCEQFDLEKRGTTRNSVVTSRCPQSDDVGASSATPSCSAEERLLAIDVGAGTQDILLYESGKPLESCIKMVLPSQTTIVAWRIERARASGRDVFLKGNIMGGWPCVSAIKRHIKAGLRVYATPLSAKTIRDNPREVEEIGVQIVEKPPPNALTIETRDVDINSLRRALSLFEVELPTRFAVAVQDHGTPYPLLPSFEASILNSSDAISLDKSFSLAGDGEAIEGSQRRFRFQQWRRFIEEGGHIAKLAYLEVPEHLTRMRACRGIYQAPCLWTQARLRYGVRFAMRK